MGSGSSSANGAAAQPAKPHDIEIVYFDAKGRAQATRITLAIGGIAFKDTRLTHEAFGALLASGALPLQTVPILKVDGKVVSSQSAAMLRYAAYLANLQIQPQDTLISEEILATTAEYQCFGEVWFNAATDDDKKRHAEDIVKSGFAHYAKHIESLLASRTNTGNSAFCGQSVSFVDVFVFTMVESLQTVTALAGLELPLKDFPLLAALIDAVGALPAVQAASK